MQDRDSIEVALPFPVGGINDDSALSEQAPLTSRLLKNVRGADPKTGRIRGAQRSGRSKYLASRDGAAPIKRIVSVSAPKNNLAYAARNAGSESTEYSVPAPSGFDSYMVKTDSQSNTYWGDGKAKVVKRNPDGTRVWQAQVPVQSDTHICRALCVDQIEDSIYVGASEGSDPSKAVLCRFDQIENNQTELVWTLQPGMFVEECIVSNTLLYTIQNNPETRRSKLVVYYGLDQVNPSVAWSRDLGYPANGLALGADGSIYVTSERNPTRTQDPLSPLTSPTSVSWTPESDLANTKRRTWSHYTAEDVDGVGNADTDDQTSIAGLLDASENFRDWFQRSTDTLPKLFKKAFAGRDVVRFNGTTDSLITGANANTNAEDAALQRTAFPAYRGSKFFVVLVFRAPVEATQRWLFGHNFGTGNRDHLLFVNASSASGTTLPPTTSSGGLFLYSLGTSEAGAGAGTVPVSTTFSNVNRAAVVAFAMTYNGATGAAATDKSFLRVNGTQIDVWNAEAASATVGLSLEESGLGWFSNPGGTTQRFNGDFCEMYVIRDDAASTDGLLSAYWTAEGGINAYTTYQGTSELEKFEGWAAHKWGLSHLLPASHPYFYTNGPPVNSGQSSSAIAAMLTDPAPYLAKFDSAKGDLKWVLNDPSTVVTGCTTTFAGGLTTITAGSPNFTNLGTGAATFIAGDSVDVLIGGNAVPGNYVLSSKTSNTVIVVTGDVSGNASALSGVNLRFRQTATSTAGTFGEGGLGYGIATNSQNEIFCQGPPSVRAIASSAFTAAGANHTARRTLAIHRKVIDAGSTYTIDESSSDAWAVAYPTETPGSTTTDTVEYHYTRPCADARDNGFFPYYDTTPAGGAGNPAVVGYTRSATNGIPTRIVQGGIGNTQGHAVAADPRLPTYQTTGDPARAEFIYAAGENGVATATRSIPTQTKLGLVSVTQSAGSFREIAHLLVTAGKLKVFTTSALSDPTFDTGLSNPIFDTNATYIDAAVLNGEAFFGDGMKYFVYRKKTGTVYLFKATSAGQIPPRCRLFAPYRGRLIIAGDPDNGTQFHASKRGNPYDWDFRPAVVTPESAFTGVLSETAGAAPDFIRGLVPYDDDLMVFLCGSSWWRMTGDPRENGGFDQYTDVGGAPFGRPWCKDPEKRLFVASNRGHVYVIASAQSAPVSITRGRIYQRLRSLDYSAYHVQLDWNHEDDGLHLSLLPFGNGGAQVEHYFWERRTDAWFPDTFGVSAQNVQPTAIAYLESDTGGVLVHGCEDGYVRKWDRNSNTDDSTHAGVVVPVATETLIGPVGRGTGDERWRWSSVYAVLATDQGSCNIEIFCTDDPTFLGSPVYQGVLEPGENRLPARGSGAYMYAKLKSAHTGPSPSGSFTGGKRWALEKLIAHGRPCGRP